MLRGSRKGNSMLLWQSCWFESPLRIGQKQGYCCSPLPVAGFKPAAGGVGTAKGGSQWCRSTLRSTLPILRTGSVSCWYPGHWYPGSLVVSMLVVTAPGLYVLQWSIPQYSKTQTCCPTGMSMIEMSESKEWVGVFKVAKAARWSFCAGRGIWDVKERSANCCLGPDKIDLLPNRNLLKRKLWELSSRGASS